MLNDFEPWHKLMAAVLAEAGYSAKRSDLEALAWLAASENCENFCIALSLDYQAIRRKALEWFTEHLMKAAMQDA
jgi:hypothetical protein